MSIDLDLSAIQLAAKNSAANPWLMANVANVANLANEKQPNNHQSAEKLATLAGLATLAISQTPANAEKAPTVAPALDPGLPRLLGAAMALCDRTDASGKTRQDWRADIEAALPEHRGDLLALVQALMPKAMPPTVVAAAPNPAPTQTWRQHDKADQLHYWSCPQCLAVVKTDPAKPLPPFHAAQPWRAADKQWLAHWQQCPQCQTAGRTNTDRCTQGEDLFTAYQQAIETGK